MSLEIRTLAIAGPLLVTPRKIGDARGFFSETYNAGRYAEAGIAAQFVQDNHSCSAETGTVRGLHFQSPPHAQAKLIRVARGRLLDVLVDMRKGSPSYGRHVTAELSAANWTQIFVPIGFAHGFCTLEPDTEVVYKVDAFYAPDCDAGIRWNDPALDIAWPDFAGAQVSAKDKVLPLLADYDSPFVYRP